MPNKIHLSRPRVKRQKRRRPGRVWRRWWRWQLGLDPLWLLFVVTCVSLGESWIALSR